MSGSFFIIIVDKIKKEKGDAMNNTLTIMVGLPASGKDFFIKNNIDNALILSSDNLRVELYGYEDQTHNKEVFEEMNRRTRNAKIF